MIGYFFEDDKYLKSLNLDKKIKKFLESFKEVFWEQIFDEVFIISYINWEIKPLYLFCWKNNCDDIKKIDRKSVDLIKNRQLKHFSFFIDNVISKMCIINNEWVLAREHNCEDFDIVFRLNDYYFWLNNSKSCFKDLQEKLWIEENVFFDIIKKFYKDLGWEKCDL